MVFLNAAAQSNIDLVVIQLYGQLRLIHESLAGASQSRGGEGYGGDGPGS